MFRNRYRLTKTLIPLCGSLAAVALASDSRAATVERTAGNNLFFTAAPGADNHLSVHEDGPDIIVGDSDDDPVALAGCVQIVSSKVKCPSAGIEGIYLLMQDGTNTVQTSTGFSTYAEGMTATKNTFSGIFSDGVNFIGGPNHDQISGSSGPDTLDGGGGPDSLSGGVGDDTLRGGAGNDAINPGFDEDTVEGGSGVDTALYSTRDEDVNVSLFDDLANDGELGEKDTVKSDVENAEGGKGDDTLTGDTGANTLYGAEGHDTLWGGGGADFLYGQDDGDNLFAQGGLDTVVGGEGGDLIDGGADADEIYGSEGIDSISGGAGEDDLDGGADGDGIHGGTQDDVLYGKDGDDRLYGDAGADKMFGEAGSDTVLYPNVTAPLRVDLDGVAFDDGPEGEGDTAGADVENVTGGPGADVLTGNAAANVLRGGGGNDTLDGLGGTDSLFGELGDDNLLSRDGAQDADDCGAGADTFTADAVDTLVNCEAPPAVVTQQPPTTTTTTKTKIGGPVLRIGPGTVRLNRRGQAVLKVRCSAKAKSRCIGTLKLQRTPKGRTATVGSKRFSIKSGRSGVVRITLSRRTRRAIGRPGMKVKAVGSARDTVSAARTTARKITIHRARR